MKTRTTLFAMAGVLVSLPALSQQQSLPSAVALESEQEAVRRYSVELIIFEYAGGAAGTTEIFDAEAPTDPVFDDDFLVTLRPDRTLKRVTVINPDTGAVETRLQGPPGAELAEIPTPEQAGVRLLGPDEFQLTRAWDRLVALDAYRPLLHTGWEQPATEKEDAVALDLRRLGDPPLRLSGTLSLYLSRYLHLVVDLALEEKNPVRTAAPQRRFSRYGDDAMSSAFALDTASARPSVFYRISEDSIVRNDEIRYFDHPKFGVIARTTRIEEAESDDTDTTGDLLPGNAN